MSWVSLLFYCPNSTIKPLISCLMSVSQCDNMPRYWLHFFCRQGCWKFELFVCVYKETDLTQAKCVTTSPSLPYIMSVTVDLSWTVQKEHQSPSTSYFFHKTLLRKIHLHRRVSFSNTFFLITCQHFSDGANRHVTWWIYRANSFTYISFQTTPDQHSKH